MTNAEATVLACWAACEARDWDTFGALLADDVVHHLPQARERITGRAAFVRGREPAGAGREPARPPGGAGSRVSGPWSRPRAW
ncbi:nuclear transport factor 2 family protein [Micromonospora sp. NPDC049460]|uniref:nuclear transport factor 2 family protein n=1 Tax=unclassified Micromonospora TaxID=2617518 RepID=UPI00371F6BBC